jgi:malonate decarboxylase alpha subunit
MIPAIESGWVKSIHSFGSEVGMDRYVAARPDVFFIGHDGSRRSNRVLCQLAGQYAVDAFIGSTLQMDGDANSSTVTSGRLSGFGGAPNIGHDPHGRRHSTPPWLDLITEKKPIVRGRKLVVQTVGTFQKGGVPAFVETLDAVEVGKQAGMPIAPVMIYGDDVSHVVTEEGVAYLYKAEGEEERRRALAAVAGVSPVGLKKRLPMWHRYRVEFYPHVPGLGIGSGIVDKYGNELEFPSAFRQCHRNGKPRGIVKINMEDSHDSQRR